MTTEDALLAAIIASPADDLPRLVYADWLDENGQPERAEFIRVQCELGSGDGPMDLTTPGKSPLFPLRARERELWMPPSAAHAAIIRDLPPGFSATPESWLAGSPHAIVRRGFVAEIHCTLADWCGDDGGEPILFESPVDATGVVYTSRLRRAGIGPEVVRRHPVAAVVLTDREPWGDGRQTFSWWIEDARADESERQRRSNLPESVYSWINCFDNPSSTAGMSKRYPNRQAADSALSAALIAWAKSQPHPARIVTSPVSVDFVTG